MKLQVKNKQVWVTCTDATKLDKIHNDCFQSDSTQLVELFFTDLIIQTMFINENLQIIKTKYTLVNNNSNSNLVSKFVIKTLKIKIIFVTNMFFKMINRKITESESITWLMINVTKVSRIIAAWVINIKFKYILLLKWHWMQSVHLIDDYDEKIYTIQNDKNEW